MHLQRHGTAALAAGGPQDPRAAARQKALGVARQFEQVFAQMMVSNLRESTKVGGDQTLFGEGPGADTYAQWFDQDVAGELSAHGHLGIADQLMKEFERSGQVPKAPPSPAHDQALAQASKVPEAPLARGHRPEPTGAARPAAAASIQQAPVPQAPTPRPVSARFGAAPAAPLLPVRKSAPAAIAAKGVLDVAA